MLLRIDSKCSKVHEAWRFRDRDSGTEAQGQGLRENSTDENARHNGFLPGLQNHCNNAVAALSWASSVFQDACQVEHASGPCSGIKAVITWFNQVASHEWFESKCFLENDYSTLSVSGLWQSSVI